MLVTKQELLNSLLFFLLVKVPRKLLWSMGEAVVEALSECLFSHWIRNRNIPRFVQQGKQINVFT